MSHGQRINKLSKILIANRGEIACRVMKTARKMNIKTVAVFSDADRHSLHVKMADEAHYIGPSPASESYLRQDKLMDIIKKTGAQAVHPGYGFLSEQAPFAEALAAQGVEFIGPPASAIAEMGSKSASKRIMIDAGVSCVPGYHGDNQDEAYLKEQADQVGYPIIIKAVSGGGGKGMRMVFDDKDFMAALRSAKEESIKAFNDDRVILERFFDFQPRHVEVQVMADSHGNAVYFSNRDCSVQRRYQKIIEEAPAPGLTPEEHREIGEMAVRAAKAVGYKSAGTVEFIMDTVERKFYFMEMNTRLQVEHPITELVTGVDLVELQLRVSQGEALPFTQEDINVNGHAFEARVYAEDPDNNFMPGSGDVNYLSTPAESETVRIDTSIRQGDAVSVFYDPMIAKLVVWAPDRLSSLALLHSKLQEYHVVGLSTNIKFLKDLATHPNFESADVHTDFIKEHGDTLFPSPPSLSEENLALTAVSYLLSRTTASSLSPWTKSMFSRLNLNHVEELKLKDGDTDLDIKIRCAGSSYFVSVNSGSEVEVDVAISAEDNVIYGSGNSANKKLECKIVQDGDNLHVFCDGSETVLSRNVPKYLVADDEAGLDDGVASVEGLVQKIFAGIGDVVKAGDIILQVNVMKMLFDISAHKDGVISSICFNEGDRVSKGQLLYELEE
ncbi:methylcrotonoyl-CoA carboxylase subunit alpha, mitochondrial-like [Bolinopsis microptera]|uniref:methylcrotonoyl-CoA carboxylase subunit alpha, mitochondrial-like n=1 Tax=Bolinopsis microptera TaxID=2820187 RepID=UPI003078B9B3